MYMRVSSCEQLALEHLNIDGLVAEPINERGQRNSRVVFLAPD